MSIAETDSLAIAVVRPFFTLSKGGAERYAVELVRGLLALGHAVHVFAYDWDRPPEPGVKYHRVWMPRKPAWLRVLIFHWNIRRQLDVAAYDAVLGMTPFFPQTVFWLGDGLYSVWTRVAWPISLVRRLMCVKRTVMGVNLWLEKRMLTRGTERFIAISQLIKDQATQHYGVPPERIDMIHPGIDTARFNLAARARWRRRMRHDLAIGDDEVAFLFAANNYRRKGLVELVRAFGRVTREKTKLRLIVIGAGPVRRFRRLARRCGVEDKILFRNFVDAIEKYYAAADVFVLPSRYDPFGSVCLEAMACGLPVITSRMAGAAELIEPGKTGYVIESNNTEEMLEYFIRDLANGERCATMGALAAEQVKDRSNQNHIRQIGSALRRAASARKAKASLQAVQLDASLAVNRDYLLLLKRHGLDSVAAVMEAKATKELFYNRAKQIALFTFPDHDAPMFFVKRHRVQNTWFGRIKGCLDESTVPDGVREWNNLLAFHRAGLPAVTPIAAGERRLAGGIKESFVMTLGLTEYSPLDDYLATRACNSAVNPLQLWEKRRLIRAVAALTRDMHWSGFNHRDFYLCHIFVKQSQDEGFDLRLIDLQRAGYRKARFKRWLIKDLAQLHYSSLAVPLSDRDRLRFYALYESGVTTRPARRRRLRRILRKSATISRHDAKLRGRHDGPAIEDPVVATLTEQRHSGSRS